MPRRTALPRAPVPVGSVIETSACVYPNPPDVMLIEVITPFSTVAVAAAPEPSPLIMIVGLV